MSSPTMSRKILRTSAIIIKVSWLRRVKGGNPPDKTSYFRPANGGVSSAFAGQLSANHDTILARRARASSAPLTSAAILRATFAFFPSAALRINAKITAYSLLKYHLITVEKRVVASTTTGQSLPTRILGSRPDRTIYFGIIPFAYVI